MPGKDRKTTSVFVDNDIVEHVKNNSKVRNLSEWINTRYPDEFMNLVKEEEELKRLEKETELARKRVKEMYKTIDESKLPELAQKWIEKEGIRRVESGADEGYVLKYFNNKFNMDFSIRQFRLHLETARQNKKRKSVEASSANNAHRSVPQTASTDLKK